MKQLAQKTTNSRRNDKNLGSWHHFLSYFFSITLSILRSYPDEITLCPICSYLLRNLTVIGASWEQGKFTVLVSSKVGTLL